MCFAKESGLARSLSIEDAKSEARKKGGKFLSKEYTTANAVYLWECANRHQWRAKFSHIKHMGSWCPRCSSGSGEESVRLCFQKIFRRRFPKQRPEWLQGLELDGYNARIQVAFEHQGRMHYQHIRHFHGRRGSFKRRLRLDRLKHRLCRQRGIRLVRVPEVGWKFPLERLLPEVIRRCRRLSVRLPAGADRLRISYVSALNQNPDKTEKYIPALREYARKRGGELLDQKWHGGTWKYRMRCKVGHIFEAVYWSFMGSNKAWCTECGVKKRARMTKAWWAGRKGKAWRKTLAKSAKYNLETLQAYARKRGGKCLTTNWQGSNTKCRFRCGKCGREWGTLAREMMKKKSWCMRCGLLERSYHNFLRMQDIAKAKGGRCLSNQWLGTAHKYRFRCGKCGREWETPASSLLYYGFWCKPCSMRKVYDRRRAKRRSPSQT